MQPPRPPPRRPGLSQASASSSPRCLATVSRETAAGRAGMQQSQGLRSSLQSRLRGRAGGRRAWGVPPPTAPRPRPRDGTAAEGREGVSRVPLRSGQRRSEAAAEGRPGVTPRLCWCLWGHLGGSGLTAQRGQDWAGVLPPYLLSSSLSARRGEGAVGWGLCAASLGSPAPVTGGCPWDEVDFGAPGWKRRRGPERAEVRMGWEPAACPALCLVLQDSEGLGARPASSGRPTPFSPQHTPKRLSRALREDPVRTAAWGVPGEGAGWRCLAWGSRSGRPQALPSGLGAGPQALGGGLSGSTCPGPAGGAIAGCVCGGERGSAWGRSARGQRPPPPAGAAAARGGRAGLPGAGPALPAALLLLAVLPPAQERRAPGRRLLLHRLVRHRRHARVQVSGALRTGRGLAGSGRGPQDGAGPGVPVGGARRGPWGLVCRWVGPGEGGGGAWGAGVQMSGAGPGVQVGGARRGSWGRGLAGGAGP